MKFPTIQLKKTITVKFPNGSKIVIDPSQKYEELRSINDAGTTIQKNISFLKKK